MTKRHGFEVEEMYKVQLSNLCNTVVQKLTKEELMVMTISKIISELLKAVDEHRDVNLNKYFWFSFNALD